MTDPNLYDVIIVGAGPAGLAAGLYAARDGYKALLLEKNGLPGGQIMLTERIENYPGYEKISGPDLVQHMSGQAQKFGAEIATGEAVTDILRAGDVLNVSVNDGEKTYAARAVILAPGSDYRQLGVPGETTMRQAGKVSYCATCDGAFYRGKDVITVGGGNTAVEDTIYLATRFTRHITMIHRRKEFRAQKVLVDELNHLAAEKKSVDIKLPYVIDAIVPTADEQQIDHVRLMDLETGQTQQIKVDGVFIFVGMVPNTGFLKSLVPMDDAGFIACDPVTLKTDVPGVFVAGDCRQRAAMQLATASADGVIAAMALKEFFRNPTKWKETAAAGNGSESGW